MDNNYENRHDFEAEKKKILSKKDRSKIGSIDDEIKDLVNLINSKKNFCTTSSCAGRITLIERKSERKIDTTWLIASHKEVTFEEIKEHLKSKHDTWLMQESFIIHIFCRTLDDADRMLKACHNVGIKRTGITSLSNKIMIECMGNEKVETIVIKKGKVLIDDEYLNELINECNSRMRRNRNRMERLYKELSEL